MASVAAKKMAQARAGKSRSYIHVPHGLGERAADVITGFVGSWLFVGIHTCWFLLWIVLRIEPFPFGLLTLLVSLEAIFLSTFVMMSQNRSAQKDHIRDDHEATEVDLLYTINEQQMQILQLLRGQICPDEHGNPAAATSEPSKAPAMKAVRRDATPSRRRR